jgi:Ala-tRNA(Pro) deacylase
MSQEHDRQLPKGDPEMKKTVFQTIIDDLSKAGIAYALLEHEPVYTMEQAREICGNLPEQGVKTLFAKAYKSKKAFDYFLIVWTGNKQVDFQQMADSLGVKKTKLATPEEVKTELGIEIGALSPFGYQGNYPVVFDKVLLEQEEIFINPGVHDKTIKLRSNDLRAIVEQSTSSLHLL